MTYTAWWSMDSWEITEPADAQEALEEAWARYYPHGGRGISIRFGDTESGEGSAPLRVDIDLNEGRARVVWLPTGEFGAEPDLPPHPRPLLVGLSPYDEPTSVSGGEARVTPGAALRAVGEYAEDGQRPRCLHWQPV